ncbi:fimbrillin family protein [Prevotella copri]|uniref:Fimbrillin family protein n=1 Tax=Segatella copri TaxID=165179 RepID=A0AAW4NB23_9BACT|nr:fimbrillin family protein [Segatella copri]MBU9912216.1 fimbrillin family protein [Segatella copri]MBV3400022.1 fimbrillin family protein [Segatella copri]MBV3409619.1 fimbrillin family protein [Segatella copri]MBV3412608.1 fimbrillin family protein [Segatella copri]MBV3421005.1 fimbrillin family protein [Segatella copri]
MRHRLFIPAVLALLFALAACTQDELADDSRLSKEKYPIVIHATGLSVEATPQAAPSTRASVDGDWQGVTSVALKMGDAVKEYTVTASTDFKSATLSRENDPYYWTSRDPITVSAWCPFDKADITQMPAVKVAEDQSKLADFQNSDFISAENRKVEFNNPTLEFTHRTARVTIELKPGTGFTSVAGATVSLVSLSADNGNPTAIKTYNASGNTYEALTAPQTVAAGKPFVRVELGGGTFYFRPQNNVVLEAGNRYKYTVKVNASGLTLEGCTIGDWADGGGESGEAEDLGYSIQDDGSYMVYNADGLLAWNKAAQKDESINCTLTADIDLTGKEWTQVGTWPPGYSGIFNGQGHRITGLNFSAATTELFGLLNERGVIKNLQLIDVNLYGSSGHAAGIVEENNGQIIACSVTGKISAYGRTSSIADLNYGSITACWFNGTLEEYESGAIVRHNYAYITSCYWGGNAGQGVFSNLGGKVDATKVDGATVKWQTAVDGMNTALTNNDYQWALGTDGLPVLQKRQ